MSYNFQPFKQKIKDAEEWLKKEFATIRTGRVTPAILDVVKVEAYGGIMSIVQLANISIEDVRTLRITPWDMSQVRTVEKGILSSGLGLSVAVDDKGIRVIFPELTSDRRGALIKIAKQKLEEARVTLRTEREKIVKDVDGQEKAGKISEDEKFRLKTELQKMINDTGNALEQLFTKKEREISK
ncbi:MAG: ribosome recycling factor [Candidatus Zambryskibacteria bacterium]|nr:ribosome recycling factor [Candidatus Zambryskibacteria bacterium]